MPQGHIFTSDMLKQQLKELNTTYDNRKTWENLYGNISMAEQEAISSLKQNYSSAIGEAYLSSFREEQNILSSNIGQGYKEQMLNENEAALEAAFASYQQNYLENVENVKTSVNEAVSKLSELETTQANYAKEFYNTPYAYLEYLKENYDSADLWNNKYYSRFLNEDKELLSWNDIVLKEKLFNNDLNSSEAEITKEGTAFYQQILLDSALQKNVPTYWEWLGNDNSELFDWLISANGYTTKEIDGKIYSPTNKELLQDLIGVSDDKPFVPIAEPTYSVQKLRKASNEARARREELNNKFSVKVTNWFNNKITNFTKNIKRYL
jgi:hypothetical protein